MECFSFVDANPKLCCWKKMLTRSMDQDVREILDILSGNEWTKETLKALGILIKLAKIFGSKLPTKFLLQQRIDELMDIDFFSKDKLLMECAN